MSSGSQQDVHEEHEHCKLWARLSPQAEEQGWAPGDIFFSFCGDGSVSCVLAAVGQGMSQMLPTVCWHLYSSPTCLEKWKGYEGAPGLAGNRLAVPPELLPAAQCCFLEAADSDGFSQSSFVSEHCGSQPWPLSTGTCAAQALALPTPGDTPHLFCSGGAGGGGSGRG